VGKIVFWLVVVFAVLLVLRLVNTAKSRGRAGRGAAGRPGASPPSPMVRCVECGVFLPQADARPVPQGFHCGQVNCAQQRSRER
jgi:hypothetical protein